VTATVCGALPHWEYSSHFPYKCVVNLGSLQAVRASRPRLCAWSGRIAPGFLLMSPSQPSGAVDLSVAPGRNVNAHRRSADATGNRAMPIRRKFTHMHVQMNVCFSCGLLARSRNINPGSVLPSGLDGRAALEQGRPRGRSGEADDEPRPTTAPLPYRARPRTTTDRSPSAVPGPPTNHDRPQSLCRTPPPNHIKTIKKLDNRHADLANMRSCLYRCPHDAAHRAD
jgi:hypothetical protein